jgi:hypothetical protein
MARQMRSVNAEVRRNAQNFAESLQQQRYTIGLML